VSSQPNCRDKAGNRLLLPVMFAAAFVLSTVTCLTGQARVTQTPLCSNQSVILRQHQRLSLVRKLHLLTHRQTIPQ
jgi:hypothetical protein